ASSSAASLASGTEGRARRGVSTTPSASRRSRNPRSSSSPKSSSRSRIAWPRTTAIPACACSCSPTLSKDVLTRKYGRLLRTRTPGSCGPSAHETDPLTSERVRVDDAPVALYELSLEAGWGDGLPLLPPTEQRVRDILASTPYHTDDVVGVL